MRLINGNSENDDSGNNLMRTGVASYSAEGSVMFVVGSGDNKTDGSFFDERRCIIRR